MKAGLSHEDRLLVEKTHNDSGVPGLTKEGDKNKKEK